MLFKPLGQQCFHLMKYQRSMLTRKVKGGTEKRFSGPFGIDRGNEMFEELGISFGTALIVLLALYFIIKWAVKNGIKEAYRDITGKVTTEDIEAEQICNEEEK